MYDDHGGCAVDILKILILIIVIGGILLIWHQRVQPLPIGAALADTAIAKIDTHNTIPGFPTNTPELVIKLDFQPAGAVALDSRGNAITPVPISNQPVPLVDADAQDIQDGLLTGDVGTNVRAALNANGGAIRHFILHSGETWDFGRSIAPISALGYLPSIGGIPGAGWCNLAAQYISVADQLGLEARFPVHDPFLGDRFPGIWLNDAGEGGNLTITNTTARDIEFSVEERDTLLIVAGKRL